MNQTALHLLDNVLPHAPVRQWVLTFPPPLRYLLAYDHELCSEVLAAFCKSIENHYRAVIATEHTLDPKQLHGGMVTSIQRAGSALQATLHFHTAAIDGVYLDVNESARPELFAAPTPSVGELNAVAWNTCLKVQKLLRRRGIDLTGDPDLDRLAIEHPLLARSLQASMQNVVAIGDDAGRSLLRARVVSDTEKEPALQAAHQTPGFGFNLHAGRRVAASDRKSLEKLLRYMLCPPVSAERISTTRDGRIAYRLKRRWSDGTETVFFSPMDFLSKLMALIPKPRVNLVRYHGCLAPRSKLRRRIVPRSSRDSNRSSRSHRQPHQLSLLEGGKNDPGSRRWVSQAELAWHVFGRDIERCEKCGSGRFEVLAVVTRYEAIGSVLSGLGLSAEGRVLDRARGPPGQLVLPGMEMPSAAA